MDDQTLKVLDEAAELLRIAHYAHQKMGLEGAGARGHPHEVRVFALHFGRPESPKSQAHTMLAGDGRFQKWWAAYKELVSSRARAAE